MNGRSRQILEMLRAGAQPISAVVAQGFPRGLINGLEERGFVRVHGWLTGTPIVFLTASGLEQIQ